MSFLFLCDVKNAQNRSLKNDVINGYGYWAICLPKTDILTWNLACQISKHGSTTYYTLTLKILDFEENYLQRSVFSPFWVKNLFFIRDSRLKNYLCYVFGGFYLHFDQNRYFGRFSQHLSTFDQKCHDIGSLTSV